MGMTDFTSIFARSASLTNEDKGWLRRILEDWQVIADLSFADLMLVIPIEENNVAQLVIAAQCRSSTVVSRQVDDMVGRHLPAALVPSVMDALNGVGNGDVDHYRMVDTATVCDDFLAVKRQDRILGVIIRETNMIMRLANGHYESESIHVGRELFDMIGEGTFPYTDDLMSKQRHDPRVSDGFLVLSAEGVVEYAAPNAVSCFRRLGVVTNVIGRYLSEFITEQFRENDKVPESLPGVLAGKFFADSEITTPTASIALRCFPLFKKGERTGAVILCRDVTEVRRREMELETKEATIAEVHHRVKNNLQAVSSLLRLQSRRTKNEEVRKELQEAQRRLETIAVVHEGLSQTADEVVDFDAVISQILRLAVEVASTDEQEIKISYLGQFGMMPAQDATPLSLVLTELVTNCVEHGFKNRKEGNIRISVGRSGKSLNVVVEDDGNGLETEVDDKGKNPRESGSGLGTQIINTFVTNDFGGTIRWSANHPHGTRVDISMKLRAAE